MKTFSLQKELIGRQYWLIRLRWIAVAGVFVTTLAISRFFKFSIPVLPLYAIAVTLAAYNSLFFFLLARCEKKASFPTINRMANAQISVDLLTLTVLIHFSGGIENPFIFYFIFHMIIAGILLSRRASFLQATLATALFCLVVTLEYFGVLRHYSLEGFITHEHYDSLLYIGGVSAVFISTLYIAVYLATSIAAELRQREETLEEANELLKENDRIKSEYVLRVSHDIKEHLAAIQGCLDPVVGGITGELNMRQRDLAERASQRTGKLLLFVRALLEITRMKLRKEIPIEDFSFKEILNESVTYISAKAAGKNIPIDLTMDPSIDKMRGAKAYIQEVLINLLANAVKYTPRNGKVTVRVVDKGSLILITVSDTGIGIPKDDLPRIFEEFYRASNAKETERDGSGLGLSIVKQVVDVHNGKVWVESEEGKGSTFTVELPK